LFLAFLILIFGCAGIESASASEETAQAPSVYARVTPGKTLRVLPEFLPVDDFNTRDKKNLFGYEWKVEGARRGTYRVKYSSENAITAVRGSSLKIRVGLPADKSFTYRSGFGTLDMSGAEGFALKCRIRSSRGASFSGRLELSLSDWKGASETVDLTPVCLSGPADDRGWREVALKHSTLQALDWNQLKEIFFTLRPGSGPLTASVEIDEITFYGKGDVGFGSQRDNLIGFPNGVEAPDRAKALLSERRDEPFLYEIAKDTWKFFENALDRETRLPVDHIRVSEPSHVGTYTTPTNLAMYFLACVSARELGFISKKEAVKRIKETLKTLERMKRWQGFYYNFYDTGSLQVTRDYISTVDSGWLAVAWVVLRQAFPKELGSLMNRFLEEADFYEFYDPSIGQLRLGFDETLGDFAPHHYGLLATEARSTSFVGIGKEDLPREHWWFVYRTPPSGWDWQSQVPQGQDREIEGSPVFQGYYKYQKAKFIPSWGGSLFEFLMPTLVMKEKELSPRGLGLNNRVATEVHIDYALNRQGYPIWGLSPASVSSGRLWRYGEYGVKALGVKGYRDEGVVTPYVTFLALDTLPEQAIDNLRRMLELYKVYGEYGFYDSINVRNGRVNAQYLALDQGMSLVAIANYLRNGVIKEYFHRDEVGRRAESLLGLEEFFPDRRGGTKA